MAVTLSSAIGYIQGPFKRLWAPIGEIFIDPHLEAVCVWKIFIPFILLVLIAPFSFLILPIDHPFHRAFAHGDLLIFSGLVLIEGGIELSRARLKYGEALRGLATLMLFSFGFVKIAAMLREPLLQDHERAVGAARMLLGFSFFSVSAAVAAVVGSLYAFLHSIRKENVEKAKEIVPEPQGS